MLHRIYKTSLLSSSVYKRNIHFPLFGALMSNKHRKYIHIPHTHTITTLTLNPTPLLAMIVRGAHTCGTLFCSRLWLGSVQD